jgi:hypothetical protein
MLISSYGVGARPLMKTGSGADGVRFIGGGGCGPSGNYLAIVGLEFYAYTRDPSSLNFDHAHADATGLTFLNPFNWLLIEDCKLSVYSLSINADASINPSPSSNLFIRRNVIADDYATDAHSQGAYISAINNVVVEENLFDHDGWNASVSGADPTIFNHNVYIQYTSGPPIFRGNISANASATGAQVRPGGTVADNLFVKNPVGLQIGTSQSTVSNNVITEPPLCLAVTVFLSIPAAAPFKLLKT